MSCHRNPSHIHRDGISRTKRPSLRLAVLWKRVVLLLVLAQLDVRAADVEVIITGQVEYNQVKPVHSRLGHVQAGDGVTFSFLLDATRFMDSNVFPTRGYVIEEGSLKVVIGQESFGMQDPDEGALPMFILRNNDPAVDGFLIGSNVNGFEDGAPLDEQGAFGPFKANFLVGYDHDPLPSLDILDAVGTYGFDGITSFNLTIDDGAFHPVGIVFEQLLIKAVSQHEVTIEDFDVHTMSFDFQSVAGAYHVVEASPDLQHWKIVGEYSGNGDRLLFVDERSDLGRTQFFRIRTQEEPFTHALLERNWYLIAIHESNQVTIPEKGRVHSMELMRNRRVSGMNDCNRYFGGFSLVHGNLLDFDNGFGSTLLLCPPGSLDRLFFEALSNAGGYEVEGDVLTLFYGPELKNRLVFEDRN